MKRVLVYIVSSIGLLLVATIAHGQESELLPGRSLKYGESITSDNAILTFGAGFLALRERGGAATVRWTSGKYHQQAGAVAIMQTDGNLVIYDQSNHALWSTGTYANPGAKLTIDWGRMELRIFGPNGTALWSSTGSLASPANAPAPKSSDGSKHQIGESWGGGVVFMVSDGGLHGVIAAPKVASVGQTGWKAAKDACAAERAGGFADWRMPSKDELNEMFKNQRVVPDWRNISHWSGELCSEKWSPVWKETTYMYWSQQMDRGIQDCSYMGPSPGFYVRPVRSF